MESVRESLFKEEFFEFKLFFTFYSVCHFSCLLLALWFFRSFR
jgi:ABC-type polysaccharide/polyol phosphate export permease